MLGKPGVRSLTLAWAAAVAVVQVSVVYGFPAGLLTLERAFPVSQRVELEVLRARDRARHARILQGVAGGVVDFSVSGTSDPYLVGLYFTKVRLGSPPREFNVQIDTGSDILWVTCNSCSNCPQLSGLGIELNFFDALSSSTSAPVRCSDPMCASIVQTAAAQCSAQGNQCGYSFQYGDGSGTSGYYVTDLLYFDAILGDSLIANSSAAIVFGCSTSQSGDLTKTDRAIDGIFGFGQQETSVVSQLSSRGVTPKVFSHCLKGDGNGGGILVLGEILDPSIVYSPLVPSQPHYNLYLQSIAVNGQLLPIDSAVFATSSNRGTIVDSGTTLTYLVEEAYDPFVSAVSLLFLFISVKLNRSDKLSGNSYCFTICAANPFKRKPMLLGLNQVKHTEIMFYCYNVNLRIEIILLSGHLSIPVCFLNSILETFPTVSLNFAAGASMILKPADYLVHLGFVDGAAMWCIGFQRVQDQGITILGDLVLKDKIFVYDLARKRIGWADYDCSSSVNVSITSSKDEFINAGQLSTSSSTSMLLKLLHLSTKTLIMHILVYPGFLFM
ncbi:hypothetical protein RJ640_024107 [Escallonia rubra]|uniref:Peptidase A1 domain-containing protein n=1 Tax=Escallonia rubra TaxID=112253 RepID=A0AA88QSR0_9ASTE|nr:hypothetical protein RJ640_024107 [Escallonia rubra]